MGEMTWQSMTPSLMLVVVGGALWWWSIALTLRAYRAERLSAWKNPRSAPRRAVAARAFGAALVILGVGYFPWGSISAPDWAIPLLGGAVPAALLVVPYLASVAAHNRRVGAAA